MAGSRISFQNTRLRFQRLRDAKLFYGWVSTFNAKGLVVATAHSLDAETGDRFRFEVFGTGAVAVFDGKLELSSGSQNVFSICTPVRTLPSAEEMRIRIKDATIRAFSVAPAIVSTGVEELDRIQSEISQSPLFQGRVLDVSVQGIGVRSSTQARKGEHVRFEVEMPVGVAEGLGEVRYCKKDGEQFRIGISIRDMDRLNRGVFERLLRLSSAA